MVMFGQTQAKLHHISNVEQLACNRDKCSDADTELVVRSLWRNGRARWTSNPEVPGSSPGRDDLQAGVSFILLNAQDSTPLMGITPCSQKV
ncbi:hypothetical protein Y1Q_0017399 [Alligator mississippiensis]|uniref:Uncharacterized protein n=1 Tax=Alligator mississippiensis TaxID=8496 RepID=A0A151NSZ2_ALLMI|nr:hypothetical protein Y1Q_0017399 [Alligator mississippiensis]